MQGCDTFDCVAPTRLARTGTIYHDTGTVDEHGLPIITKLNLMNAKFQRDLTPLDFGDSPMNAQYTKAYLAHLFKAREMLGGHLASIHNLWTIVNYTKRVREKIYLSW